MKVLVTGANGFLGYYLCRQLHAAGHTVLATGKGNNRYGDISYDYTPLDFTDPFAVHDVFEAFAPEAVIHTGAMSKPDECERDQWQAYLVNVEGTLHLLANAEELSAYFLFVSTDFVFDGETGMYTEEAAVNPVNYYGKTKAEAEEAVQEYAHAWSIVRTVLVYGLPQGGRGNLLSVVKEKLEKGETYQVVSDQWRTPTFVEDLAAGIVQLVQQRNTGIYHLCGPDGYSPYEMAKELAALLKLDAALIQPCPSAAIPGAARRPLRTGLNIEKARKVIGYTPVSFREGLRRLYGQ